MPKITLKQGDCLELLKHLPDGSVDFILTDPPYGMDYKSNWSKDKKKHFKKLKNDRRPFIWFLHDAYRVLKDDTALVCFSDWRNVGTFKMALEAAGFTIKNQIIWDRQHHGMGDLTGSFAPTYDIAIFAVKGRFKLKGKREKDVLSFKRLGGHEIDHPTMKPVELLKTLMLTLSSENETVLDPFMGSGSTGVACKNLNRDFIGFELDEKYFSIAEERIANA